MIIGKRPQFPRTNLSNTIYVKSTTVVQVSEEWCPENVVIMRAVLTTCML